MDDKLEQKIIQALEGLEEGQSLDQVLSQFPEDAEELRPALEVAVMLSDVRIAHSIKAQSDSRRRFLERAEALQQGSEKAKPVVSLWRRLFAPVAFVMSLVLILGVGTFIASQSALPGDVLYGAKRTIEGVRLSLTRDLQAQERLQEAFQEERLREITVLLASGRQAEVDLEGEIESISGDDWLVTGIPVWITDETIIDGSPEVGAEVQIKGRTTIDEVEADEVLVEFVEQPAPEPTPLPTASIPPKATDNEETTPESGPSGNQPTNNTPTATLTATPTWTPTPTPTATATATATSTSTPIPSSTPTPVPTDDNTNDNDNENNNDNDNTNINDNDNDNDDDNTNTNDNDNDNSSGPGGGEDNDNDNTNTNDNDDNNNDNDNDNSSGPGNGSDNDNDNNSGPGGGDNDNNSGPGSGDNDIDRN